MPALGKLTCHNVSLSLIAEPVGAPLCRFVPSSRTTNIATFHRVALDVSSKLDHYWYRKLKELMALRGPKPPPSKHQTIVTTDTAPNANTAKLLKLLHRIAADDIERYEHAKLFTFPFFVDEQSLRKLREELVTGLGKIPVEQEPEFKSETRFDDLSLLRFYDFEAFLASAGNRKDPESAQLSWNKFSLDVSGEPIAGDIQVSFVTEKRLQNQDDAPGQLHHAYVQLSVSGSDSEWVESTYSQLQPFVEATQLGGIYRPLWIFRNKWFLSVLNHVIGWIGFFIGIHFAEQAFAKEQRVSESEVLRRILTSTTATDKIDLLARNLLTPSSSPWWRPILVMSMGALSYSMLYFLCMAALPRLTPNSSIAIGLTSIRARNSLNTFRFVVFTLLLCGVVVPLGVELLKCLH